MPRERTHHHRRTLFTEAVEVIADSDGRQLSIDEVAHRIATSRRQLQRVFEEVGGVSFREFLTQHRAERAAQLLADGIAVSEVARRTGYGHASHFARAFKRHHGVPPSRYTRAAA